MECICHTSLIRAYAAYLDGMWCVGRATTLEGRAIEGNSMIPARENKIANKALISIDNEVSAEFFRFLMVFDKFCGGHGTKVTSDRLRSHIKLWDRRRKGRDLPEP